MNIKYFDNQGIVTLSIMIFLILVLPYNAGALNVNAKSCNVSDIQSATDAAYKAGGGTVTLPSCTVTHSSQLKMSDGVSLIGAGQGSTNITNANFLLRTDYYGNLHKGFRFSGMSLLGNSHIVIQNFSPIPKTLANGFRIDHVTFETASGTGIDIKQSYPGLIDHCTITVTGSYYGIMVSHDSDAYPACCPSIDSVIGAAGAADAIYIEDSTLGASTAGTSSHFIILHAGARLVARNNIIGSPYMTSSSAFDAHGTGYGSPCGARLYEVYNNTFISNPIGQWKSIGIRGGSLIAYNNTFKNHGSAVMLVLEGFFGSSYPQAGCRTKDSYIWDNIYITDWPSTYPFGVGVNHADECPPDNACYTDNKQYCCYVFVPDSYGGLSNQPAYIQIDREFFMRSPSQSSDGWTYTPLEYPHPRISSDTIEPSPPKNLRLL